MQYEFKKSAEVLAVSVSGELDHHNAAPLREAIDDEILKSLCKNLIIDLSGLDLMDSSGIGVIMGRYKLVSSLGGKLCVSGAAAPIRKIIELSGLCRLVLMSDTLDQAAVLLKGGK